jgi:pyruvate kinase
MLGRRTKIVATLGPATDAPGVLDALVAAGLDCARLNCSHGAADDLRRRAAEVRAAAARSGRAIALLADLQGPKLRLNAGTQARTIAAGELVTFAGGPGPAPGDGLVVVDFPDFPRLVTPRSEIVIGDGVPRLAVEHVGPGEVVARAVSPGPLAPRKGINVTYARPELPAITEKDLADLEVAAEIEADFVALSFVRSAADIEQLRDRLQALSSKARTIAKIEKVEAYEKLDEIIAVSDGVMVARGDYGVEAGVARVPLMQKDTIFRATQEGKVVITATQMLESMIHSPEPTRAEATDVANAVIDGTSAVMLSAETSVGDYPVESVRAMAQIATFAEEAPAIHGRAQGDAHETAAGAVMRAAVQLADDIDAAALVVPTATGGTARACSKYRRNRPIVALAHVPRVVTQLALE